MYISAWTERYNRSIEIAKIAQRLQKSDEQLLQQITALRFHWILF